MKTGNMTTEEEEKLEGMLMGHEAIVYNVNDGNRQMSGEEVFKSRKMILQYVKSLIMKEDGSRKV